MPNWIEGTFKVRGTIEQIQNFARNEFNTMEQLEAERGNYISSILTGGQSEDENIPDSDIDIVIDDYDIQILSESSLVFKSLRRAYSGNGRGYIEEDDDVEDQSTIKQIVIFNDFQAAWAIDPSSALNMAQKYNIDIYFHGFEKGMEFEQILEIVDGKVKKSIRREYDNYTWECPFPNLGG